MTTVTVLTLGCKVNQFESEALLEGLEREGYRILLAGEKTDVTIVNTCTVTHRADFQSRQMIRRCRRANPDTLLIVTGCGVQVDPEPFSKMEGVRFLIGNEEKPGIPKLLRLMEKGGLPKIQVGDIQGEIRFRDTPLCSFHHHTRAFLKIQDGCNSRCSYCIVPFARGRSRSLDPQKVLDRIRDFRERGFQEVVLTGIHVGAYGLDLDPITPLEKLLERLERSETPPRIRITSIEPGDFSEGLKALLSQSCILCPHLHIPIQSGSEAILKRMNRNYNRPYLTRLILELHDRIPDLSLGADFIVGFPGETETFFQETLEWVDSLPFTYLHVFPFSRRRGTAAAQFPLGVKEELVKIRSEQLRTLGAKKRRAFYQRYLGRRLDVLIERRDKNGKGWKGFSRNYIPVLIEDKDGSERLDWKNQELAVEVIRRTEQGVIGQPVDPGTAG